MAHIFFEIQKATKVPSGALHVSYLLLVVENFIQKRWCIYIEDDWFKTACEFFL